MGDLVVGLSTLRGHFVRGFPASAIIEAVSYVGCNQPLLVLLCILIAPDYRYLQGSIATIQEDIGPRSRAPLMMLSGGWYSLRPGLIKHLDLVTGMDIGLPWKPCT
jgi:hypothetical protein